MKYLYQTMRKLTLIFLLLFWGQMTFGQTKEIQNDELLFEKGFLLQGIIDQELDLNWTIKSGDSSNVKTEYAIEIKEAILKKALEFYEELIYSYPKSNLYYRTLNNKGIIEFELGRLDQAKKTFTFILDSEADDKEEGGFGSGIMAEPFANYKNIASTRMARIYIQENNYLEAIKYLELTKKYPYLHFCGNGFAADAIFMSELYGKCYLGLNEYDKAYKILLPNLLENGLADNSDLVDIAYNALLKKYTKEELKIKYEQAFKNYKVEKVKKGKNEYQNYFISFLGNKIEINSWKLEGLQKHELNKEIEAIYKKSKFYKLLNM